MVSFKRFGQGVRFGNQIFQYAFIRSTARRLGVNFFVPKWKGDETFLLNDKDERVDEIVDISKTYTAPENNSGFDEKALQIEDGTDIFGYFHTDRYYDDPEEVKHWFTFKEEKIAMAKDKYRHINFSKSCCLHLRLGDKADHLKYCVPSPDFYKKALSLVRHKENILVFSDTIEAAKKYLRNIKRNFIYMENNKSYEDLYLMSQCHDFIFGSCTLAWWGAWLSPYDDKIVVVPKEGYFRPGVNRINNDWACQGWIKVKSVNPILGCYRTACFIKLNLIPFLKLPFKQKAIKIIDRVKRR